MNILINIVILFITTLIWNKLRVYPIFYSLDTFMTAWHEVWHALAAWLTGGSVQKMEVHNGYGVTTTLGGYPIIIFLAGFSTVPLKCDHC